MRLIPKLYTEKQVNTILKERELIWQRTIDTIVDREIEQRYIPFKKSKEKEWSEQLEKLQNEYASMKKVLDQKINFLDKNIKRLAELDAAAESKTVVISISSPFDITDEELKEIKKIIGGYTTELIRNILVQNRENEHKRIARASLIEQSTYRSSPMSYGVSYK